MVEERVTDGRRIAQLLASEIRGHERGPLDRLTVVDVEDVEGSEFGEFAYGVDRSVGNERVRVADVYVHDERARVEFREAADAAADAGREAGLRTRPKATTPPRTLVFVESGVEVKRVLPVFRGVVESSGG
jgi:hypothetical protein